MYVSSQTRSPKVWVFFFQVVFFLSSMEQVNRGVQIDYTWHNRYDNGMCGIQENSNLIVCM